MSNFGPPRPRFTAQPAERTSLLGGGPARRSSISSMHSTVFSERYSLAASPRTWGTPIDMRFAEDDDELHNPSNGRDRGADNGGFFSWRGLSNVGCLFILFAGILTLFGGYPILSHFLTKTEQTTQGGFNLGGINATGQVPDFTGNFGLIDQDTPEDVRTKKSYNSNEDLVLVFSDEFNRDGRTFWPGDDPYWEAVDLWYWGTVNLEWYDPMQVTTDSGYLRIALERVDDRVDNHNQSFKGGMVQSWNKFCFTGGLIEASVLLPGSNTVGGLWPALWTMGNLGRAGFGASLEGMWPYSYDSCDVGTLPNQTYTFDKTRPVAATQNGDPWYNDELSYLPGQRLSACTCPGEIHPGPIRSDGTFVGRAAPEIDIFEAIVDAGGAHVSMSCQWAPFNAEYLSVNTPETIIIHESNSTMYNEYVGGAFQQTTSGLVTTNPAGYERSPDPAYIVYGFEYKAGFDDAYITWIHDSRRVWTVTAGSMVADTSVEIDARPIPVEPMYIIANLGLSPSFGTIDFETLELPAVMSIDWIRVYQPANAINVGCNPPDYPTASYIEQFPEAYTNANHTIFTHINATWPKNRLTNEDGKC
ncbi:killer toxin resistant protein [Coprinopsis sp. MPI-PUGE-AT-0042]|nr:killer toxin resistant protein [Coprinopsis sp. MPI-PUGE-AT-0042]